MIELLLVRHGQTDWNLERRIMGSSPIPLNQKGRLQIQRTREALASIDIDLLYSSPHQRTYESSLILTEGRKLSIQTSEALREIEYGTWVGKTFQEIRTIPQYQNFFDDPHFKVGETGESLEMVRQRSIEFIEKIRLENSGKRIMLVSHADWIKCVVLHYLQIPLNQIIQFRVDNASLTYLILEDSSPKLISFNLNFETEKLFVHREVIHPR